MTITMAIATNCLVKPAHQFLLKPIEPEELKCCIRRSTLLRDVFLEDSVRAVVSKIDCLPSVPKTYALILDELSKDNISLKTVAETHLRGRGHERQHPQAGQFGLLRHAHPHRQPSPASTCSARRSSSR